MEIFTDAIQYLGLGYDALVSILIPAALLCLVGAFFLETN